MNRAFKQISIATFCNNFQNLNLFDFDPKKIITFILFGLVVIASLKSQVATSINHASSISRESSFQKNFFIDNKIADADFLQKAIESHLQP